MSREWKPGSVVRLSPDDDRTDGTLRSAIGVVVDEPGRGRKWLRWFYCDGRDAGEHGSLVEPSLVRPLVVIDPEDREAVERLLVNYYTLLSPHLERTAAEPSLVDDMQAALREFAAPKPPRPDEPQGLGAVVEDEDGTKWIRHDSVAVHRRWLNTDDCETRYRTWLELGPVVRVLSPGVEVDQ